MPELYREKISFNGCQKSFTLESLIKSDDGDDGDDGNENGKKATGLIRKNNNSARASRFFVHFFAVTARLRREKWLISLFFLGFWRTRTQDNERLPFVRKFR